MATPLNETCQEAFGVFLHGLAMGRMIVHTPLRDEAFIEEVCTRPPAAWELILQFIVNRFIRENFLASPVAEVSTVGTGVYVLALGLYDLALDRLTGLALGRDLSPLVPLPREASDLVVYHALIEAYLVAWRSLKGPLPAGLGPFVSTSPLTEVCAPELPGERSFSLLDRVIRDEVFRRYAFRTLLEKEPSRRNCAAMGALFARLAEDRCRPWGPAAVYEFFEAYQCLELGRGSGRAVVATIRQHLMAEDPERYRQGVEWFGLFRPLLDLVASGLGYEAFGGLTPAFIDELQDLSAYVASGASSLVLEREGGDGV